MSNIGFIGTGNMGGALATAASTSGDITLYLSNKPITAANELAKKLEKNCPIHVEPENTAVISQCDYVFLGVKPQNLSELANEIRESAKLNDRLIIVSMLAGTLMAQIEDALGYELPIIRIMPNIAAKVGEGMILYTYNERVTSAQVEQFLSIMQHAGTFVELDEPLFSAGSGISGCGPAFLAMFVEALADGGVDCGMPRDKALLLAAQMCKGTAEYLLSTGEHPSVLKDKVCSPGGTTIEGVRTLENYGMHSAVMEAVIAAYEKDLSL